MKTDGDVNFGIDSITGIGDTDVSDPISASGETGLPYAIIKSTHPRLIAREEGSIRIVNESGSSIVMDDTSRIQIRGSLIEMGSSSASQPYIRYSEWEQVMQAVISEINTRASHVLTIHGSLLTACASGSPSPFHAWLGWTALLTQLSAISTYGVNDTSTLIMGRTNNDSVDSVDITSVKSSVIYGE